ncbi:MAG: glycoside hydrolase family 5 protein [Candidatus Baldrarchaeia archaeon]
MNAKSNSKPLTYKVQISRSAITGLKNPRVYSPILILFALIGALGLYPAFSLTNSVIIGSSGKITTILPLHVEGKYIKNSLGQTVYLRGINKHSFEGSPRGDWQAFDGSVVWDTWDESIVAANLDAMKSWGINTVRSYACAEFWINNTEGHREIIKQYAELLAQRGMYLIYTFWCADYGVGQQNFPYSTKSIPDKAAFVNLWISVANELKDYPNVIFSLWNEPTGNETQRDEWFAAVQDCINAIRSTGAENLIIVEWDGVWFNISYGEPPPPTNRPSDYGATMWWVEGYPLNDPLGNLIYEFHSYRGGIHKYVNHTRVDCWEYEDLKYGFGNCCLVNYVLNTLNKPVICGEIGPNMWRTGEELQHELLYYQNALKIFDEWGVHYTAFWWWMRGPYAHLTGKPNYQPNEAGQILKSALLHK